MIVDEVGLLNGPAVLLSMTPQKYTFHRRRKDLSGRMARLAVTINRRLVTEEVRERETHGDMKKTTTRQRVNIRWEILTLAPFISIVCLQLAFPHVETLKYIYRKVPAYVYNIFVII